MSGLATRDDRGLFARAWTRACDAGWIDAARREALVAEATKAIRRIATVLGSESLRDDLERAMRAMLGLVELHLAKTCGGDVDAAARALAEHGLLFHTRGASRAIKRVVAIETGLDPESPEVAKSPRIEEAVVGQWARMPYDEFARREQGAERVRRRRQAARAIAASLRGDPPGEEHEPEQVIVTALLVLAYGTERRWTGDRRGFEALLKAARAEPRRFERLPDGIPPGHAAVIAEVHEEAAARVIATIADPAVPLHLLVAGDPEANPLAQWLAMPEDALGEVDELDAITTEHWRELTGGHADDERLLWLMLREVCGVEGAPPLAWKATEALLRGTLSTKPEDRAIERWVADNAPHELQSDLLELWHAFWEERLDSLDDDPSPEAWKRFMRAWLPMRESAAKR